MDKFDQIIKEMSQMKEGERMKVVVKKRSFVSAMITPHTINVLEIIKSCFVVLSVRVPRAFRIKRDASAHLVQLPNK